MEFAFTLRYRLASDDCNPDVLIERLGDSGCTDALIGIGRSGYLAFEFLREADSAEAARAGAVADIRRVIPTAELIESKALCP